MWRANASERDATADAIHAGPNCTRHVYIKFESYSLLTPWYTVLTYCMAGCGSSTRYGRRVPNSGRARISKSIHSGTATVTDVASRCQLHPARSWLGAKTPSNAFGHSIGHRDLLADNTSTRWAELWRPKGARYGWTGGTIPIGRVSDNSAMGSTVCYLKFDQEVE